MRVVGVPAVTSAAAMNSQMLRPRGPRGGNLDEVREEGLAIVSDLLNTPHDERDYHTLTKANLEKMSRPP